jgi:hypothetical protein
MRMEPKDLAFWQTEGFLHLPRLLESTVRLQLTGWVEELSTLPPGGGRPESPILQHFEQLGDEVALARTENLVPNHEGIRSMVTMGPIPASGSLLMGEPVVLYKEKVNHKMPGGAGFEPHQDATAYKFVDLHLTCMIAIDETTEANGCLEVSRGHHHALLPTDGDGCIAPDAAADLRWEPVPLGPGDVLWFHSRTPHRSGPNRTDRPRRALFLTYNARSQGDLRTAYYQDKIRQLASHERSSRARVSTIGHFKGLAPETEPA